MNDGLRPVPATRSEAVASALRDLIRRGEYAPGTRLMQAAIAERFGVSTTPVREAFASLAREGLVRQDPHRGVVVFQPSLEELRENYEIRVVLEGLAAELAAPRMTDEALADLEAIQDRFSRVGLPGGLPWEQGPVLNQQFHARMYAEAERPRLVEIIATLRQAATSYLGMTVSRPDMAYRQRAQAEHEAILAALRARDGRAAGRLMRAHLRHNEQHVERLIAAGERAA